MLYSHLLSCHQLYIVLATYTTVPTRFETMKNKTFFLLIHLNREAYHSESE